MANMNEIYKCNLCGNIVEVTHEGVGILTCCDKAMQRMEANTQDASKEKHVPVVKEVEDGILVCVGSIDHPMEEKHYIEWIEVVVEKDVYRKMLMPGQKAEAKFGKECIGGVARAYCNLHGLWTA